MFNLYSNSSIYLTSRTTLVSFHDHPSSSYANVRRQPCSSSSSCCCCSCCCNCCSSFPTNSGPICSTSISTVVPINPSLLYGLRQSTLIQWPPSRRKSILTAGFERRCYAAPINDLGLGRSGSSFSEQSFLCRAKERGASKAGQRVGRKGELGFSRRRVLEKRYEIVRRSSVGSWEDAESILSLLSNEVDEVARQDVGEKKGTAKRSSSRKEELLDQRDDNVGHQRSQRRRRKGRESVPARPVERDSNVEMESVRVTRRYNVVEDHSRRRDERREAVKDEDCRPKKSVSSYSSSYCTCSVDGYVSDDIELEANDEQGLVDTAKDSSGKRAGVVISKGRIDGSRSDRVEKDQHLETNKSNKVKVGNAAEWDWRKKSEKKLSEEFADDTKVRYDSVSFVDQSTSSMAYAGSSANASSSRMQSKASVLDVNSAEKSRSQVSQKDAMASFGSRHRYDHVNEFSGRGKETLSSSSYQFSGQEENMSSGDYCRTCGQITVDSERQTSRSEQSAKLLKNQGVGVDFNLFADLRESELRRCRREETSNLRETSVNKSNMEHRQDVQLGDSDQHINAGQRYQVDVSSSDQQAYFSQIDNLNDEAMTSSFDALSEARFNKRDDEENSILLQASIEEVNKQRLNQEHSVVAGQSNLMRKNRIQTRISDTGESCVDNTSKARQHIQKKISGESSGPIVLYQQNVTGVSTTQREESRRAKGDSSTSGRDSEQRLQYEQLQLREKLKTVEHHRIERHEMIDERIKQSEVRYVTQMPIEVASFQKGEVSSSQIPAASSSQIKVEELSEGDGGRNSQLVRMSSHRATKREPAHVEPASKVTRQESGNRRRQASQGSSSRIRVEEIEDEDETDSLIRSASRPTVEVEPADRYTRRDSDWSSQESSQAPSSHTGDGEIWEGEYERNLQMKMLPPPPQMVERDPVDVESANEWTSEDSGGSYSEVGGIGTYEDPSDLISGADVMGSAERMDHMSHQVVGEFIEKARHEASTSLSQTEGRSSQRHTVDEGKEYKPKEENLSGHETNRLKKAESSHHSSGSRYYDKGPTDELWRETDLSLVETKDKEPSDEEEGSAPGNDLVRRSGRSLWNVLGYIVRLRWSNRSESHRASGASSGDSASSEAWFDPDSTHESNSRRGTPSRPEDASPSAGPSMVILAPENASPYSAGFIGSSTSEGIASRDSTAEERRSEGTASIDVSLRPVRKLGSSRRRSGVHEMTEEGEEVTGSGREEQAEQRVDDAEGRRWKLFRSKQVVRERFNDREEAYMRESDQRSPQLPRARQLGRLHKRSGVGHEMTEEGEEVIGSGQEEQAEQRLDLRPEGVSVSEGNDADMRRRKLLRTEEVVRERFDDWEEAYRWESKQRKVDEIFMREALVEANKAADLWEVPVGAVLVRDGKIVARGHNLVEELRDSTAHAEMICIREASNALRTWRLAEATLYVTLEPCAMCAGAILQARVGTLVYGAPNKLLGADGSWIRLFPGSTGGEGTSEQAGPIHPFHPNMTIRRGILQEECADAMQNFFRLRRKKEKKKSEQSGQQHSHLKISLHPSRLFQKMQHMFHFMFCL